MKYFLFLTVPSKLRTFVSTILTDYEVMTEYQQLLFAGCVALATDAREYKMLSTENNWDKILVSGALFLRCTDRLR